MNFLKIIICVLKMNKSLASLELHEGEHFGESVKVTFNVSLMFLVIIRFGNVIKQHVT